MGVTVRKIVGMVVGVLLVGAAAFQYSPVLSLPEGGDDASATANDQLVSLDPEQLLAVAYTKIGSVPCEQGQGADSPYECGNTISFATAEFPAGDIESVSCDEINSYTFDSIDNCAVVGAGGNSGNVNVNIQVNQQPCDNPALPFVAVVLTKTVAAGGDVLTLSLTPNNCST